MRIMTLALLGGAILAAAPATAQRFTANDRDSGSAAMPTPHQAPHAGLSADETTWHLRAALNVAALSCRDADARETTSAYNTMLEQERVPLDRAVAGIEAQYRARYGNAWQAHDDGDMTRLYNSFAAPNAQPEFCAVAKDVLHAAASVEPSDFAAFAAAALPALERPFAAPVEMAARVPDPRAVAIATNAPVALTPGH